MKALKAFLGKHRQRLVLAVVVAVVLTTTFIMRGGSDAKSLSEFTNQVTKGQVASATVTTEKNIVEVKPKSGGSYEVKYPESFEDDLIKQLQGKKLDLNIDTGSSFWNVVGAIFGWLPIILIMAWIYMSFRNGAGGLGAIKSHFGGDKSFLTERPTIRFSDVKGADEAIEDLRMTVDAIKDPANYQGPPIHQGILLEGPTGTGKTLLARAVAGEAGVPFYFLSGTQLTNMFVNGSARLVEQFFEKLKAALDASEHKAAVVFIDEMESLVGSREHNSGVIGNSQNESDKTVLAMLHQLGILFDRYRFVVVIGATNHKEKIDKAILRPGRIGKHIPMPNPDEAAREQMILKAAEGVVFEGDIDFKSAAALMAGMSGAQVTEVMAEARRLAWRNKTNVTADIMREATIRIAMGVPRTSAVVHPEDRKIAAIHESGHALGVLRRDRHSLQHVTIIPIGDSGGSTWHTTDDRKVHTLETLMDQLVISLGGLAAEEVFNPGKSPSVGASHDLERATSIAINVVCTTSLGGILITIDPQKWEQHPLAKEVNKKVGELLDEAHTQAQLLVEAEQDFLRKLQATLLDKQSLSGNEVAAMHANATS